LRDELLEIFIDLDPLGIHAETTDELALEATSILARLREARVADDLQTLIVEDYDVLNASSPMRGVAGCPQPQTTFLELLVEASAGVRPVVAINPKIGPNYLRAAVTAYRIML